MLYRGDVMGHWGQLNADIYKIQPLWDVTMSVGPIF